MFLLYCSSTGGSPLQSQTFSGSVSESEQLNESFEDPSSGQPFKQSSSSSGNNSAEILQQSEPSVDPVSDKSNNMKKRMEEMKRRMIEFEEKQEKEKQKLLFPDPAPYDGKLPTSFSSPQPDYTNDPSAPTIPTPTVRGGSQTTIAPQRPLNFKSKVTTHPGSQTIVELDETILEEDVPVMPTKCPVCQSHLNQSGVCTYCSPISPPLKQTPIVKPCPVPVPRPRIKRLATDVHHLKQSDNLPPLGNGHAFPLNNSGPCISPGSHMNNSGLPSSRGNNSGPVVHSDDLDSEIRSNRDLRMEDHSTLKNESVTTESMSESTLTDQSNTATPRNTNDIAVRCEALDHQFEKYSREAEHFGTLSLEEQDEYLDKKIDSCLSVNHLKSYYKGRDWFARKEAREIAVFVKLNPHKQKEMIDRKNERKERISHLAKYYDTPNANQRAFDEAKNLRMQKKQRIAEEGSYFCEWIKVKSKNYTSQLTMRYCIQ